MGMIIVIANIKRKHVSIIIGVWRAFPFFTSSSSRLLHPCFQQWSNLIVFVYWTFLSKLKIKYELSMDTVCSWS